jgi:hypothetical protein
MNKSVVNKTTIRKASSLIIFLLMVNCSYGQKIATLEIALPKPTYGTCVPVSIDLSELTYLSDTLLTLFEIKGEERIQVPCQIEQGEHRRLHWVVNNDDNKNSRLSFELIESKTAQAKNVTALLNDTTLIIRSGDNKLLQYYYKTCYPPDGVDTAYRRSGFIHPLWAPNGQILTRIQPPDHYHHYGIWNPWTHVLYEGDTIDFWNLHLKQGTVRFANFLSVEDGSVFSEYQALHEHMVFKNPATEKTAMNEIQKVRVYKLSKNGDNYIVDINIQLNCPGDNPIKILEYRYAGLGWRTTEKWTNKNSEVLTSEGLTRKEADGSRARWCMVQGEIDNDYAGVIMMSFPTNYNHPEPLRIWPEDIYNRGDMFANFCPTKDRDWLIKPHHNYSLSYRLLVFNGKTESREAESAWYYYANPPKVSIKLSNNR